MSTLLKHTAAVGLVTALAISGGCASDDGSDQYISASDVQGKTPELATMTRREGQLKNKEARVVNSYLRSMRSDISRLLLLDHPTRLAPHPMP